jgi:shikimate kinase
MKIFLVGMPGSGKTTIGKLLAEKMKIPFVDLDAEIEKSEGQSINQIFENKGENYFRELETKTLGQHCSSAQSFVLSTGGGTPCFLNNMKAMNGAGETIFLDVPTKEIADRLAKTALSERPLFAQLDSKQLKDKIELMFSQRISYYREAKYTFAGNEVSVETIASTLRG